MRDRVNKRLAFGRHMLAVVATIMLICTFGSAATAATIQSLKLLSDSSGQSLRIGMDAPAEYQVFNLEGPDRLVLSFPGATLSDQVSRLPGDGGVEHIEPVQDSNGVRIEIGLAAGASYEIAEKGNDLLLTFATKAAAQQASDGALLQDIEVRDHGGMTELVLRGQYLDANHNALVTNNGKTMVIDFWGGQSRLPKEFYSYTSQRINDVSIGAAEGRMRVVVSLRAGSGDQHQIDAGPNEMVVRFGQIKPVKHGGVLVEAVDFQPDDRIAHLVIRTDSADPVVNLQEENDKIILDVQQASLADGQERSQDVRAFPGPVSQIDSYSHGKDVRIVARLREKSVVISYQTGNVLTVTVKPADLIAKAQATDEVVRNEKVYTGQKVTFNYKDIDIRNALQLIAEMSSLNIIMSDDVTGLLTMRLVDVPWDQALDLILTAKGLGKEKNGNVIRIAPLAVLKADADARKDAKKSTENIAPLETEFFELGYAKIDDVRAILRGDLQQKSSVLGDGNVSVGTVGLSSKGEMQLLSDRGTILMDRRSNTLIVTDTRERLNNISRLIKRLDKPLQQIMIEARIVEASDTFSRDLGVKWGGKYNDQGGRYTHTLNGAVAGTTNVVDLGATVTSTGGAIGYSLGTLSKALNLNLELSAAEQEGKIKVVSSPRVFTSNLKKAVIKQIRNIYFPQSTSTGQQTTTGTNTEQPIKIPLTLEVTPQITADKRVILILKVDKGTPVVSPTGSATVDTKTVETTLLVKNGETVVLGGIYSKTTTDTISGVPGLKDIPLIGNLFKRKQKSTNRNELLIFITPSVIDDAVSRQ